MGTGASKHGHARRKVQAVTAFEDAGKRRKKKSSSSSTKSNRSRERSSVSSACEKDQTVESPRSNWAKVRERTVLKNEADASASLRLSDFNKVVRKRTLEKEDEEPIDIPYDMKLKVSILTYRAINKSTP